MHATSIATKRTWYNRQGSSNSDRSMHHLQSPRAGMAAFFHLCSQGARGERRAQIGFPGVR